ncbi:c-type cytochrome [Fontibacter flavus]|uniref:C-type cytochrome n=1 Tax=Fontibacter flavus TaxID=654838 RepID=A0ABV6FQ54_9BACT
METVQIHIEQQQFKSVRNEGFTLSSMRWAVFFFLMASLLGLLMRYFFVGSVFEAIEYKNILHAHSHIALLGWGYLLVTGILVFTFVKNQERLRLYKKLLFGTVLANIGMLLSFPVQGYGLFSITFSTIHLLISYVFAFHFLKDLAKAEKSTGTYLIKFALIWMLISSIGLWAVAPIGATLGRLHPLYFMSVQWFLHFQLNGWFVYALLGILAYQLEIKGWGIAFSQVKAWILHFSLLLTYALAVSWSTPIRGLFLINAVGVILQAIAYYWILKPYVQQAFPNFSIPNSWINRVMYLGLFSLVLKAAIQVALVIPDVATIAYTIRMYVIGFVHLVMLGAITFGLGAYSLKNQVLPISSLSKWGWFSLSLGFILTEILILGQGTLIWAKMGFLPNYYLFLFLSSIFFPIGLILILTDIFRKNNTLKTSEQTIQIMKNNTQILINRKTMKSTMLMSFGVALLLMTSCGGGSNESQGTYTPPSAQTTEKQADPKGVGEIRSVDLGEGIDEAMASKGKAIVDMKCTACHQLNDKRVVGPGFQGVTSRRRPEWIMNMITNVDVMLDEDPVAQALLEECLTRMPNQNISIGDSRDILEFLRKNDLEKTGSMDAALK